MTDPPVQGFSRFIAIDIHKHYLMIGGIDAQQRMVLPPRKVELHRWLQWAAANLHTTDAVVLEATAEYFDEEDPIGQWIRERVVRSDTTAPFVTSTDVYDNWREWAGENGEYGRNVKTLVRELKGRGFRAARTSTARGFTGIKFTAGPGAADYAGSEFL